MDRSTRQARTAIGPGEAVGGLTRRAIVATIVLWVAVIMGLVIALEIVRSPAFVA